MDLDEEEYVKPVSKPPVELTFNITRLEALRFLDSQVSTYSQFSGFPPSHPSYKSLKRTAAIYSYIKENMK